MVKDNKVYLKQTLEAIAKVRQYLVKVSLGEFLKNEIIQDATIRKLEIIGEAVNRLPDNDLFKNAIKMRNKLIHNYDEINLEVVWNTVKKDLPVMEKQVKEILKKLGK
ncbi:MAG: DUF86 domain-containing protein [Candidatus Beckwithbacteria bacterium]|nr:DUF86 domain-containing protein [Candidatus Beckwithbacteria bacterium]